MSLTHGAITTIIRSDGREPNPAFQPILQIINLKNVGNGRYRAIVSDGQHLGQGMLATQLSPLVQSGELKENCIVQVNDSMVNQVQGRTVIILLKLNVIDSDFGQKIGNPIDVEKAMSSQQPPAAAAPAQPMYNRTNNNAPQNTYNNNPKPSSYNNPYGGASSPAPAPIMRSAPTAGGGPPITPIASLNMYQNRWTIRARLTSKSDIRTWSNAKGEGSLFSVELLDSSGTDIRGTFFKEAVDKFYNMLQVNQVYTISGGRLKVANMQYNTCKSQFEITFDQNAEIHLANDTGEIQEQLYEFVKINTLETTEAGKTVDLLVVVKQVAEPATLISKKSGQELTKCDLTVVDDSGMEVTLTVWGDRATRAPTEFANTPVTAVRHAKVSDYGGKSLSLSANGAAVVGPNVPEAHSLQQWWASGGGSSAATRSLSSSGGGGGRMDSFAERKHVIDIKNENLGYINPDKPDWLSFKGTFSFLKKDKEGGAWYTACANTEEPCKNRFKVTQTTDLNWYCDKCQGTFPNCVRRWIFSATISDDTSTTWVSLFNEQAETLFQGITADEVYAKTFENGENPDEYDSFFAKANHTEWIFKCKVKQEMVNEESRVKTSVYSMHPLDYVKESNDLLDALSKF